MNFTQVTKPNRPWILKLAIFTVALAAFGAYGLYDATTAYPARGMRHSLYLLYQYLDTAKAEGWSDSRITVEDPVAELNFLRQKGSDKLAGAEGAKYAWLKSLSVIGKLKPESTRISRPAEVLADLKRSWTSGSTARSAPKPLAPYDIPVQWLFTFIGLGGGAFLLIHVLRVVARKYKWDPEAKAVELPDGSTLTPADIEDFDKRKWDKFLVFLKIKPGHSPHGGKELKLDLYQHYPLESWILEMERVAFPDREQPPASSTSTEPPPAPAPAAT
jgi:hypothetical protein